MKRIIIISFIIILMLISLIFVLDSLRLEEIPILMYHSVDKENELNKIRIRPDRFESDLIYLKDNGYTSITFDDLIDHFERGVQLPKKPILITFDDGYLNNYNFAYPILKKHKMKASIFLVSSRAGVDSFNGDPRYTYFNWENAKEMIESGYIKVYPHSHDLHNYEKNEKHGQGLYRAINENNTNYYKRLKSDTLKTTKLFEEKLGYRPNVYAYPYGNYTKISENVLKGSGYKVTLATKSKIANIKKDLFLLTRFNIGNHNHPRDFLE